MTRCRLCQSPDVGPLPFTPAAGGEWVRCRACESDTALAPYDPGLYADNDAYRAGYALQDLDALRADCRSNCLWFQDHALHRDGRRFLDVGCGPGAALDVMGELGWEPEGFEVTDVPAVKYPVVVRPLFHRWWWPHRFAAVMAREVFEHIPGPEMFLHECHGATEPAGLFQVQTPKPLPHDHVHTYGRGHLFLASPGRLKALLSEALFDVIDAREWDTGHAYLCRARA